MTENRLMQIRLALLLTDDIAAVSQYGIGL